MNKTVLDQMWDQFRQKYGVYLRLLDLIPADRYATHPVSGMRTPAELAVHISGTVVRDIAEKTGTPFNKAAYDAENKREAEARAKAKQQPKQ